MTTVKFDESIRIDKVAGLWERVRTGPGPVRIDASEVSELDGAGLQLLAYLLDLHKGKPREYRFAALSDYAVRQLNAAGYAVRIKNKEDNT